MRKMVIALGATSLLLASYTYADDLGSSRYSNVSSEDLKGSLECSGVAFEDKKHTQLLLIDKQGKEAEAL